MNPLNSRFRTSAIVLAYTGILRAETPEGSIVAWGAGQTDQTGWPHLGQSIVPAPNTGFTAVAAGYVHSLGLKSDGSVVAWGCGFNYGQCSVPTPNADFVGIAAGELHSLGLKADGSIVAWGSNTYGQSSVPTPNTSFIGVAAGEVHSLGLKANGSIIAWGTNYWGQTNVPASNTDFVAVVAGSFHSVGLKSDGSIVAWGCGSPYNFGQCSIPAPNTGFVAVAAGGGHSLGLKTDGSIVAWGRNTRGETNVPAPNTGFVGIAASDYHSLGLKADGSIVAWGCGSPFNFGQCSSPAANRGFVGIAAGSYHSLGIRTQNDGLDCPVPEPVFLLYDIASDLADFFAQDGFPTSPTDNDLASFLLDAAGLICDAGTAADLANELEELEQIRAQLAEPDLQSNAKYALRRREITLATDLAADVYGLQGDLSGHVLPVLVGAGSSVASLFFFQASLVLELQLSILQSIASFIYETTAWNQRFNHSLLQFHCEKKAEIAANISFAGVCVSPALYQAALGAASICGVNEDHIRQFVREWVRTVDVFLGQEERTY